MFCYSSNDRGYSLLKLTIHIVVLGIVAVSNDGGMSGVEISRIEGPRTDSVYTQASNDVAAATSANTRIRLLTPPTLGNTDSIYFDIINIDIGGCANTS